MLDYISVFFDKEIYLFLYIEKCQVEYHFTFCFLYLRDKEIKHFLIITENAFVNY